MTQSDNVRLAEEADLFCTAQDVSYQNRVDDGDNWNWYVFELLRPVAATFVASYLVQHVPGG